MSAIIDMMFPEVRTMPTFTVDNTVDWVLVDFPPSTPLRMQNSDEKKSFRPGDNFNILSVGVSLPLGFEFYSQVVTPLGSDFNLPFLRLNLIGILPPNVIKDIVPNAYALPFGNYELSINQYVNVLELYGEEPFSLAIRSPLPNDQEIRISMLNVPDSLNGKIFPYIAFAKIEHTFELEVI